jgi:hypothetical protein
MAVSEISETSMITATFLRRGIAAFALVSVFAVLAGPSASAADEMMPALPVKASFGKGTPGENGGPYALTVTNTSEKALTVSATVIWSVASHNRPKTLELPAHEIAADGTWVIDDLAAEDRVILKAEGYASLELKTPPGK